jgi:outer membrane lipoprotein SlyB
MKKTILLAMIAVTLCACSSEKSTTQTSTTTYRRPAKTAPNVSSGRAEDFRAVERPSTYSDY